MTVKLTTLSENTAANAGLLAEHGLSVLIETDDMTVLLDTGLSISVCHNAEAMGVNLKKVDKIVISHGHHDHTGGLREVLRKMRKPIDIIGHPDIMATKYAQHGEFKGYIGIPFDTRELESLGGNFVLTEEPVQLTETMTTSGVVPMETEYETIDPFLKEMVNGELVGDKVLDDRGIFITTPNGLVIVLGCAHRGIINTINYAKNLTGVDTVHTVIGGCHLMNSNEERIWMTINALQELGVQRIGVSHCTGLPAAAMMANAFGDGFFFNNAGTRIEID